MAPSPLRILMLEDVPMDAELIEYELERASFTCDTRRVDSAAAFDAALREFQPHVVLSDYTLPQFDGMRALAAARAWSPSLPFIIVTGSINEETAVRCMKAGASDYLLKSNLARIGPAIEAALELEQMRTDRIRAESAVRRSAANLRAIFDNAVQGFILATPAGRVEMLNTTAARYAEELTGRGLEEGDPLPDFVVAGTDFARALAGERIAGDRLIPARDGSERWYETAYTPVLDDAGSVIGICLSAVDITVRRRVDANLRRAERMQSTGRLAGGVAHEVNNMMTAVIGFAEYLRRGLEPGDPRAADVHEILRAARRAADVTRQLLAFSRQQFLNPEVLHINAVLRGMEPMLRRAVGENHEVAWRLYPDAGAVRVDPAQIEQVVLNLALNARDSMPGGGRIALETAVVTLDTDFVARHENVQLAPGPYVMLAMSDAGHGMDAATLTRIFEPFFTTKRLGHGTGLGLSTAYGIVKQSGGFIWAYSEVGVGTTFKVYLPQVAAGKEPAADAAPAVLTQSAPRGTETILVVEDEELVRELACRSLRDFGYTVLAAAHGVEALDIIERGGTPLHLIVSDVAMPHMGGRELASRLASSRPDLPILYMSGYTGEEVVARGLLAPGAPLQSKPFTADMLADKVRQMLDRDAAGRLERAVP